MLDAMVDARPRYDGLRPMTRVALVTGAARRHRRGDGPRLVARGVRRGGARLVRRGRTRAVPDADPVDLDRRRRRPATRCRCSPTCATVGSRAAVRRVPVGPPRRGRRRRRRHRAAAQPLWETPPDDLDELLDVDVRGVWNTAAAAVPAMLAGPDPSRLPVRRRRLGGRQPRAVPPRRLQRGQARRRRARAGPRRRPGRHRRHRGRGRRPAPPAPPMLDATARPLRRLRRRRPRRPPAAAPSARAGRGRRDDRVLLLARGRGPQRQRRPRRRRLPADDTPDASPTASGSGSADESGSTTAAAPWSAAHRCGCSGSGRQRRPVARGDGARGARRAPPGPSPSGCSPPTSPYPVLAGRVDSRRGSPSWSPSATGPTGSTACSPRSRRCPVRRRRRRLARPRRGRRGRRAHGARLLALDRQRRAGRRPQRRARRWCARPTSRSSTPTSWSTAADAARLAGHFADPQVAAVGAAGPRASRAARRQRRFERWDVDGLSLDLGDRAALVRPWSKVGWLPSACLRRPRRRPRWPGFEPGRRVGEDVDLVWRLIAAGRQVRYDPSYVAAPRQPRHLVELAGPQGVLRHRRRLARAAARRLDGAGGALARAGARRAARSSRSVGGRCRWPWRRWPLVRAPARAHPARHPRPRRGWPPTLTAEVSVSTLRQTSHLLLRHWWPGAAVAAAVSRRARRALARRGGLGPPRPPRGGARRCRGGVRWPGALDDLAYGAGLWWGALEARSARVLVPHVTGLRST